jgi:predicted membrane protein
MMVAGVAFLLALGPVWATPLFVALALLSRTQALGPVGVLVGTLTGTALANPLASLGYRVGEALGFPFLGMWAALTLAVLAAQAAGEVAAFLARMTVLGK